MCYRLARRCGALSGSDACGLARTISSCGTCDAASGARCEGSGVCTPVCSSLPFSLRGTPAPEMTQYGLWDALQALTPDTLTVGYVGAVSFCEAGFFKIGDRASTTRTFTFVTPTGLGSFYLSDRAFELTPDGLGLILLNSTASTFL